MPDALAFDYEQAPTIAEFSESDAFVRGLMGPFGSGKSSGCVIELIKGASRQRPDSKGIKHARFAVIRNTYPQLKDTTIRTVKDWLPPHLFGTWFETDHRMMVTRLDPTMHIELIFRALDRPEHVSNLLSLELTGAWVNEAREVPWAIIEALQGRVGRFPSVIHGGCVDPFIILDTNPPDDESWWYKKFEVEKPEGWALFKQPSGLSEHAENKANLPPGYYQRMLAMDEESQKVYIRVEYGMLREGKPVYPDYSDSLHCSEFEFDTKAEIIGGWDFGLTPAFVITQLTAMGQWRVLAEYVADDVYFPDFCAHVVEQCGIDWPQIDLTKIKHICDPAGASRSAVVKSTDPTSCFEVAKGFGINMRPGEQAPLMRIGSVAHALRRVSKGRPTVLVHPRCKVLRRGFMGRYQYRKIQIAGVDARYHEAPDKNEYSHPHDALQYVAVELFGAFIKNREDYRATKRKPLKIPHVGVI